VEALPCRDEKISVPAQLVSAGGPATNAAVTFAFLGGRAELLTAVGSHPLAGVIREDLRKHSVLLNDLAPRSREVPPVSSIMVHRRSGHRTVVSANAAVFSPIRAKFKAQPLRGVSVLLVDGHYMRLAVAAARAARAKGVAVVMDSGSWKDGMEELLRFVDVAICSAEYRPPGCRNLDDVFEFLQEHNIRRIAITRGASAIRFIDGGTSGSLPVAKIKPIDTLGAGDIFHGAFCYYACRPDTSFRDALASAARVASFSCQFPGTRTWMEKQGLGFRD
jgi:sugar/nucleoside kinase (ribokinase family)